MKTNLIILLILLLFSGSIVQGQQAHSDMDSVLTNQNRILQNQHDMLDEVRYINPLANKTAGIEFNPAYFLLASVNDHTVLSGGVSFFQVNPKAELAFPLYYHSFSEDGLQNSIFTLDTHYRYFLGEHREGFYLSVGGRYAHLTGEDSENNKVVQTKVNKFGVMFGIGYRVYSKSGFYWGTSLSVGRYFSGQEDQLEKLGLDATKYLLDIELLKIGYAF